MKKNIQQLINLFSSLLILIDFFSLIFLILGGSIFFLRDEKNHLTDSVLLQNNDWKITFLFLASFVYIFLCRSFSSKVYLIIIVHFFLHTFTILLLSLILIFVNISYVLGYRQEYVHLYSFRETLKKRKKLNSFTWNYNISNIDLAKEIQFLI